MSKELLYRLIESNEYIEIGRKAVEDELIEFRNARVSVLRNNGLCIKEKEGTNSSVIRISIERSIIIALKAIAEKLPKDYNIL